LAAEAPGIRSTYPKEVLFVKKTISAGSETHFFGKNGLTCPGD
jgi:hypothetical protein